MNTTKILLIIGLVYLSFQLKSKKSRLLVLFITGLLFICMITVDFEGFSPSGKECYTKCNDRSLWTSDSDCQSGQKTCDILGQGTNDGEERTADPYYCVGGRSDAAPGNPDGTCNRMTCANYCSTLPGEPGPAPEVGGSIVHLGSDEASALASNTIPENQCCEEISPPPPPPAGQSSGDCQWNGDCVDGMKCNNGSCGYCALGTKGGEECPGNESESDTECPSQCWASKNSNIQWDGTTPILNISQDNSSFFLNPDNVDVDNTGKDTVLNIKADAFNDITPVVGDLVTSQLSLRCQKDMDNGITKWGNELPDSITNDQNYDKNSGARTFNCYTNKDMDLILSEINNTIRTIMDSMEDNTESDLTDNIQALHTNFITDIYYDIYSILHPDDGIMSKLLCSGRSPAAPGASQSEKTEVIRGQNCQGREIEFGNPKNDIGYGKNSNICFEGWFTDYYCPEEDMRAREYLKNYIDT